MNSYKVVIIGGGNVAYHLIRSVTSSGHKLIQIYNRTLSHIEENHTTKIPLVNSMNHLTDQADIYIICVKDHAIEKLANSFDFKDKLVVHTSGNRSKDLLKNASTNYGVFYPIQSFSKSIPVDIKQVPLIIEANNHEALSILDDFSKSISSHVVEMTEEDRQRLNIAGVFVNNFTNHVYSLAYEYLEKEKINFNLLLPLIRHTVDKLNEENPKLLQTGPAARNDQATIEDHIKLLEAYPSLKAMYQLMTKSIEEQL